MTRDKIIRAAAEAIRIIEAESNPFQQASVQVQERQHKRRMEKAEAALNATPLWELWKCHESQRDNDDSVAAVVKVVDAMHRLKAKLTALDAPESEGWCWDCCIE